MLTLDKIYHASYVLKNIIYRTELIYAPNISKKCNIFLKPENLQLTGSFKVRGSYYKISQLSEEEKAKGVIACSAGNHAQGVALAATKNGIKSLICLPDGAPISKVEATRNYGAEICLVKGVYDDAYRRALELRDEYGYTFIHPFDDVDVIAGQATIALEIIEQKDDIDAVVVPVGGGGLIAGVAFAIKSLNKVASDTKLISDDNILIFDLNYGNVLFDGEKINIVDCDFYTRGFDSSDVFVENSNMFCNMFHNYVAFFDNEEDIYFSFVEDHKLDEFVNYLIYEGDFDCLKEYLSKLKKIVYNYVGVEVDNLKEINRVIKRYR